MKISKIFKSRAFRIVFVTLLAIILSIIGFLLLFATEPLTLWMIALFFIKFIGVILFIGGFIILKDITILEEKEKVKE